jgi:hypothetical protein
VLYWNCSFRPSVRFQRFYTYNVEISRLPRLRLYFLIRCPDPGIDPDLTLLNWDFLHNGFAIKFSQDWDSCSQNHEKLFLHQFGTFRPTPTRKCLLLDPISGFKYSHLNILRPTLFKKKCLWHFYLSRCVAGQNQAATNKKTFWLFKVSAL